MSPARSERSRFDAVVVGAGAAGLYMLHRLRGLGLRVRVLEAGGDVGGTWYWNRYPGARCDIESLTYSYSFSEELQQEWTWSERYASQPEILSYLQHVADRFELRPDIDFSTVLRRGRFDEDEGLWRLGSDRGELEAAFLVMATGCLSVPRVPDIPGLARFRGETHHTGRWPHEGVEVRGKRVGIVGAGSSAVQLLPVLAEEAAHVTLFQRTPSFSVPAWNGPLDEQAVCERKARYAEVRALERCSSTGNPYEFRDVSVWEETEEQRRQELEQRYRVGGFFLDAAYSDLFDDVAANEVLAQFVRGKIRERVGDRALAERLIPYDYPIGTRRMCLDTGYYEAFRRDNVRLVDLRETPIESIEEDGVRVGGEELPLDVLVLATGFDAITGALLRVDLRGRGGRSLAEAWAGGARSYLGVAIAGFPNLFTITGPGSPSVLSNMMASIEQHVELVADCIAHAREHGWATIEALEEAQDAWVDHVRRLGEESLYPRARSWYMGSNVPGKPRVLLPYVGGVGRYRRECEEIVRRGYEGFAFGAGRARERAARGSTAVAPALPEA